MRFGGQTVSQCTCLKPYRFTDDQGLGAEHVCHSALNKVMANLEGELSGGYVAVTRGIKVTVQPVFLEEQSSPHAHHFVWAYHVRIENGCSSTIQLMTRHWCITDAFGQVHEVKGDGVVGKQPVLAPGGIFEYASGTPLATPYGVMFGTYQMVSEEGEQFDVAIPAFSLNSPYHKPVAH
jgi:ApaG protein